MIKDDEDESDSKKSSPKRRFECKVDFVKFHEMRYTCLSTKAFLKRREKRVNVISFSPPLLDFPRCLYPVILSFSTRRYQTQGVENGRSL